MSKSQQPSSPDRDKAGQNPRGGARPKEPVKLEKTQSLNIDEANASDYQILGRHLVKPAVFRALNQDLDAVSQYLDQGNYERLPIQANRMINEAAVWGDRPNLALAGLVLRLATSEIQQVAPPGQLLAYPQKQAVSALLKDLSVFLNKEADNPLVPWEALAKFHGSFWSDL